jgi:hypothetical protein
VWGDALDQAEAPGILRQHAQRMAELKRVRFLADVKRTPASKRACRSCARRRPRPTQQPTWRRRRSCSRRPRLPARRSFSPTRARRARGIVEGSGATIRSASRVG